MIDLCGNALPWMAVRIGGSDRDVELTRLHVDSSSRATTSLVRFPRGWQRPGTGHYACAEELLVLEGAITVSGTAYAAGDYGYLPPFVRRTASATPEGCLALAWFSGPPVWTEGGAEDRVTHPGVHGPAETGRRLPRDDVPGGSSVSPAVPAAVPAPSELVSLTDWTWVLVASGDPVPSMPGPIFVRSWT